MKTISVKQLLLMAILSVGVFLLLAWISYQIRGTFAVGGEIFIPSGIILAAGYLIGGKDE